MIWNDEILFIHVPKTAGMSLTRLLSENLPGVNATDRRHETLAMAQDALGDLSRFKHIFAVMRCPYTLEISRYNYLRIGHAWDSGLAQRLALAGDFKAYLRDAPFFTDNPPRLDQYYRTQDGIPPNMTVLRYESLEDDVERHIRPFLNGGELPKLNATGQSDIDGYYDAEAEALCYERHRWFFDSGFYSRRIRKNPMAYDAGTRAREIMAAFLKNPWSDLSKSAGYLEQAFAKELQTAYESGKKDAEEERRSRLRVVPRT